MIQGERTSFATGPSDEERAWACLRALAQRASQGRPVVAPVALDVDESSHVHERPGFIQVSPGSSRSFSAARALDPRAAQLLALLLPNVVGPDSAELVVAHLGQSADGYAATFCGREKFITGYEDICLTHRMRALFDAVLVGARTVEIDDPLLTTRLVPGRSPVRVILDPQARLQAHHQVFVDPSARTLVVTEAGRRAQLPSHVEQMSVSRTAAGVLDLPLLLRRLRERGLARIFIEGGSLTIAQFLRARLLHRLQLAVAPVILGPGPALPAHRLSPCVLPSLGHTRSFRLGQDTLFETALREQAAAAG